MFKFIIPIILIFVLQSCLNTTRQTTTSRTKRSKIEIASEKFVKKERFQGNTNLDFLYKNYEQLVFENSKKGKKSEVTAKGGIIEIAVNGASKDATELKNFQFTIITTTKTFKIDNSKIILTQAPIFKEIDPEYNTKIFQSIYKIEINESIKEQFQISIFDSFVNKTTIINIYPYYSK